MKKDVAKKPVAQPEVTDLDRYKLAYASFMSSGIVSRTGSLLEEASISSSRMTGAPRRDLLSMDVIREDEVQSGALCRRLYLLLARLTDQNGVDGSSELLKEIEPHFKAASVVLSGIRDQKTAITGLNTASAISSKLSSLKSWVGSAAARLKSPDRITESDAPVSITELRSTESQFRKLGLHISSQIDRMRSGEKALKKEFFDPRPDFAPLISKIIDFEKRVQDLIGAAELSDRLSKNKAALKDMISGDAILGGSWAASPKHSAMGEGLNQEEITAHFKSFCQILDEENVPISRLHDILQHPVSFLDGIPVHEALRYEKSGEIIRKLVDEVVKYRNEIEAFPSPG